MWEMRPLIATSWGSFLGQKWDHYHKTKGVTGTQQMFLPHPGRQGPHFKLARVLQSLYQSVRGGCMDGWFLFLAAEPEAELASPHLPPLSLFFLLFILGHVL